MWAELLLNWRAGQGQQTKPWNAPRNCPGIFTISANTQIAFRKEFERVLAAAHTHPTGRSLLSMPNTPTPLSLLPAIIPEYRTGRAELGR